MADRKKNEGLDVAGLIERLKEFPSDMMVYVPSRTHQDWSSWANDVRMVDSYEDGDVVLITP